MRTTPAATTPPPSRPRRARSPSPPTTSSPTHGWDAVHARATSLAASLARALAERGRTVARRDATTLVAWEEADPTAAVARLGEAGVTLRDLPGTPYLRASVGAWNDEDDLDRLLGALG